MGGIRWPEEPISSSLKDHIRDSMGNLFKSSKFSVEELTVLFLKASVNIFRGTLSDFHWKIIKVLLTTQNDSPQLSQITPQTHIAYVLLTLYTPRIRV